MLKKLTVIIVLATSVFNPHVGLALPSPSQNPLSPVALFFRCYGQITGLRPAKDNLFLQHVQLRNTTADAVDQCMQVLVKASLVPLGQTNLSTTEQNKITPADTNNGYVAHIIADRTDPEAIAVLNKFHNFHRMLFTVQDLTGLPPDAGSMDLHNDPTEPALYLTRALFEPNVPYREVVTGEYAVRGIRSLGSWVRVFFTGGSSIFNLSASGAALDRGLLWGVGAYPAGNKTWLTSNGTGVTTYSNDNFNPTGPIFNTFTAARDYGGGIMGLHSYLAMNSGFPAVGGLDSPTQDPTERQSGRSNASRRMHRRWAQSVLHDFLCRPLPALRIEDVGPLVTNYITANTDPTKQLPFRVSSACMSCHASIDPMAATARSFWFARGARNNWLTPAEIPAGTNATVDFPVYVVTSASQVSGYTGLKPKETPAGGEYTMMSRDPNFFQRPASGDLRYRSYDGSLIWQHISATGEMDGLSQLGTAMASTNDLYVCAAARYLQYFTGIEINLQDPGDTRFPAPPVEDMHYRDVAIQLGMHLKTHQSLMQLIREILSSSLYQKQGKRDVTP